MKGITRSLLVAAVPALVFTLAPQMVAQLVPQAPQEGSGGTQRGGDEDEDAKRPDAPGNADADDFDVFGRRRRVRANTLKERLVGGWRLSRMILPGFDGAGRTAQGFLHIGPSFLSLEIHALWQDANGQAIAQNDIHTTFTADYQVDNIGKLFTQTVIGSFIDNQTGQLRWERSGYEREYRVREIKQQIELTFTDPGGGLGTLVFDPHMPKASGERDIFGREEMGTHGARDIFGRPVSANRGERDIFGNPTNPKEGPADGEPEGEKKKGDGLPLSGRGGR